MANISAGTLGTFKTTKAEGRAIEVLTYCQNLERVAANNPQDVQGFQGSFDTESLLFEGSFSIPAAQALGPGGILQITVTPYLVGAVIAPGGDAPTFVSTAPEAYALEVLMYLQSLEGQATRNPQSLNYVTGTYNSDTKLYAGTFSLPITITIDSTGKPVINAVEYLSNP